MRAFKGMSPDMTARLGMGRFQFKVGETYEEKSSKTVRSGFHCCENPFECLSYYRLGIDRFFEVEAAGDIDEDDDERIACTKITIVKELTIGEFALEGMKYMINHPEHKWQQNRVGVVVTEVGAEATLIAISRGSDPMAKVAKGGIIGLIRETGEGIQAAVMMKAGGRNKPCKEDTWYRLTENGPEEVTT